MDYTKNQLEAINHLDGNVQIIACAGSGKTQTISMRIANLVLSGISKENILAFTFTEKAAKEMKLRVRAQLEEHMPESPELAGMYIGTIHAFCLQYLKEIRSDFRNYEIIDENKLLLFLSRNFYDLRLQSLRSQVRGHSYFRTITQFIKTIDIIKQNQYSNDFVKSNSPIFYESYHRYISKLQEHKFMDFSTIIETLVKILESDPQELDAIREKIKYVVVDEYQDINQIQEKLIKLIAGNNGNLCVVGDDDQSIFEFQGANINNILTFEDRYNDVKSVRLLKNFRSTNTIIEAAKDLIQYNNPDRLDKSMEHGLSFRKGQSGDMYKLEFPTRVGEVEFIADKIKELRGYQYLETIDEATGEKRYRGLDWGDFAVLIRNNSTAKDFIEIFERENIPFTAKGTAGLFERSEIRFLQMIFNYFCDTDIRNNRDSIICDLGNLKNYYESNINRGYWENVKEKISEIKNEINEGDRFYPQQIYHQILQAMGAEEDIYDEGELFDFGRFSQLILDYETVNEWIDIRRLKSFIFFLNGYAESRIDMGGLDDPTRLNTVSIHSIHKAKGLEFPVVFVADIATWRFPSQRRNTAPDIFLDLDLSNYTGGDKGERRLFYVAVTRSEKFLFLTMARDIGHKRKYNPSNFYDEYLHDFLLTDNIADPTERSFIKPAHKTDLDIIPTSFSDLQYYLKCPYDYLLRIVMGFSSTIDLSFGYGLQVHNLMNRLHSRGTTEPPSKDEIEKLTDNEFFLRYTRKQIFENLKEKSKKILVNYTENYGDDFPLKLETEKPFEFVLGDALISGEIDLITRINPDTNEITEVNLIDFKTEKKDGRRERDPLNRLQLRLYAIAVNRALGLDTKQAHVHYLSDNVRFEVDLADKKLEESKNLVEGSIQGIKHRNFSKNPGSHCEECDFTMICSKTG